MEKLKRGFEGPERVVVSLAGVGRKERPSREATLVPLAMLHVVISLLLAAIFHARRNLPWFGEVVRPLSRPQRHLCPSSQRWIVDGRWRA